MNATTLALTCLILAGSVALAQTPDLYVSPDNKNGGTVGICLLLNDHGTVEAVALAKSSGDPLLDQSALNLAKTYSWDKPYPKPGWVGIALAIGQQKKSTDDLPQCPPPAVKENPKPAA